MTPSVLKNIIRMPRKRQRQARQRISYLNADQLERLLKAAKAHSPREHAMFLFAVSHGARAAEIANLRISDLNFKTGQVHIERVKGSISSTQSFMKVKGNPLFDEEKAFKTWLTVRQPDTSDYVFNSRKSTKLNRVTVNKIFHVVGAAAELPEGLRHPHILKHTCAMLLVGQGANAFLIRQQLGHKSFDSTLAYVQPTDQQASEATAKAFSEVF